MTDRTCAVDGCERFVLARGLCRSHYMAERALKMPACTVDGCSKTQHSSGLCSMHYMRVHSGKAIGQGRVERKRCSVADCQRVVSADGYCRYHLKRIEFGLPMDAPLPKRNRTMCQVQGCSGYVNAEGYCKAHLRRFRRGVQVEFERTLKVPTKCRSCGKVFTPAVHGNTWCSKSCRNRRWNHMRRATLKSVSWTGDVSVAELRALLGDRCHLCHRRIDFDKPPSHPKSATVDHLIPLSRAELQPWHGPGNLALAHRSCNSSKGNRRVDAPMLPLVLERK